MENITVSFPANVLEDAQRLYKAQNASDIFAGVKKETMPHDYIVEIVRKSVKGALDQKAKQVQQKRATALAELQAKGLSYRDACKALGIVLNDEQAANLPKLANTVVAK